MSETSSSSAPSNLVASIVGALWAGVALAAWPTARDALTSLGVLRHRADVSSMRLFEVPALGLELSVFTIQDVLVFGVTLSLGFHAIASLGAKALTTQPARNAGLAFVACAPVIVFTTLAEELRGIAVGVDAAPSVVLALALLFFMSPARAFPPSRGVVARGALAALIPSLCISYALNVGSVVADSGDRHAALVEAFGSPYAIASDTLTTSGPLVSFFGEGLSTTPPNAPGDTLWLDRYADREVLRGGVLLRGATAQGVCLIEASYDPILPSLTEGSAFTCVRADGLTAVLDAEGTLQMASVTSPEGFPSIEPLAATAYARLRQVVRRTPPEGVDASSFPLSGVNDGSLTLHDGGDGVQTLVYRFVTAREGTARACLAFASNAQGDEARADEVKCLDEAPPSE